MSMYRMYVLQVSPDSQNSFSFTPQAASSILQATLRLIHWMTSNWPWTLQFQRYPIYVHETQISLRFSLQPTELQATLQVHLMILT